MESELVNGYKLTPYRCSNDNEYIIFHHNIERLFSDPRTYNMPAFLFTVDQIKEATGCSDEELFRLRLKYNIRTEYVNPNRVR